MNEHNTKYQPGKLKAGAAITDITPDRPLFLYGYPHVERISEGVHDPLYASAMVLDKDACKIAICAMDIIYITKQIAQNVREIVSSASDIPPENIMISASHTHSGPMTVDPIFDDPIVPKADEEFIDTLTHSIADIILKANRNLIPAEIAITTADGSGIGGNRQRKDGPVDPEVPVIVLRNTDTNDIFAVSTTYCMHPTVLHEDSKLYSADFPGYTRKYISDKLGESVIYLYHTGPEGDQSPRHFINSNTFEEAQRLGELLGQRIVGSVRQLTDDDFKHSVDLHVQSKKIMLPKKKLPSPKEALINLENASNKLQRLKSEAAPATDIRTAEVDYFGAEELLDLANMLKTGELDQRYDEILPIEIQIITIDESLFVCLPGEMAVEYSLWIKQRIAQKCYVIGLANGILRGYIVTPELYRQGGYEASNGLFPPEAGQKIMDEVVRMI